MVKKALIILTILALIVAIISFIFSGVFVPEQGFSQSVISFFENLNPKHHLEQSAEVGKKLIEFFNKIFNPDETSFILPNFQNL